MISDVLSDAVYDIDTYLKNPMYEKTYSGKLREDIVKLRNDMDALRVKLDAPPSTQSNEVGG